MRTSNRTVSLVALVAVAALSACGNGSAPETPAAASSGATGYPVTIDNCGREVTVKAPPQRVLTGYQNTVELMIALGLGDRVVGRQPFTQSPLLPEQEATFEKIPELASGLPDDAQSVAASREVQLTAQPDFVLAGGKFEVDASRGVASIEDFSSAGASVFIMSSGHAAGECAGAPASTIERVYADITTLGKIFAVPDRAAELVERMRGEIAESTKGIAGKPAPKVFAYDSGEGPLVAISDKHFDFSLAGADNVIKDPEQGYPEVGLETVAAANPEVIVTANYDPGPFEEETAAKEQYLRSALPNSAAVRDGRFVHLESIDLTPGIRNANAVRQIANALYPSGSGS